MAILVALTIGLSWWVTGWALGVKSFDAFMITALIVVLAATWYVARPFIQSFLGRGDAGQQPG
jgi:hypothetical protein